MKRLVFCHALPRGRRAVPRGLAACLCAALLLGQLAAVTALGQTTTPPAEADGVRFLEQATWGPTDAQIARVQSLGFEAWLREQFSAPVTGYPNLAVPPANQCDGCPAGSPATCVRDTYTMYPLQVRFFQNALNGPDQLRQRMAFALHEILVVSANTVSQPWAQAQYLNILFNNALGNYRDILQQITLNPAMGDYLDMVNNAKPNPRTGVEPNENYGREVLQLFSVGTVLLNPDGSVKKDNAGNPIPTYTQETIEGFAFTFTGWTYAPLPGAVSKWKNPRNYVAPMILYRNAQGVDEQHAKTAKTLLQYPNARFPQLPADQTGEQDLQQALDNIFYHPNVGPFLATRLIHSLVTSNPSPGYVQRVAAAFNNNGAGVRGDLKAVVRAILLDSEARGVVKTDAKYGKLREPLQFVTNVLRAFNAASDGAMASAARGMSQSLFVPPTVFSYFPAEYIVPGTTVYGPEFGIQSTSTAVAHANFVNKAVFGRFGEAAPAGTQLNLDACIALAANPNALLDKLNRLLLHGTMSAAMRTEILNAINAVAATDLKRRAQTAIYLVAASSQYQVQR
ncbi:MAG: DUF1800 domain-containing protein [Acidobacteria bacterium]|nr:DUF1800 domain-containing protein [Acidobacteriota bacterium]